MMHAISGTLHVVTDRGSCLGPSDSALCQSFLEAPSAHLSLDGWAEGAAMSRRSLTRHFCKA